MTTLRTTRRVEQALRHANPHPGVEGLIPLDATAEDIFHRIVISDSGESLSSARPPRPVTRNRVAGIRLPRPAAAVVAALAVTAIAVAVVAGAGLSARTASKAFADTPALLRILPHSTTPPDASASPALERFADLADQQPWTSARYLYSKYQEWNLNVAQSGGSVATAVVPTTTQVWRAADNSGRLVVSYAAASSTSGGSEANREAASAAGPDIDTEDTASYFASDPAVSALSTTDPSTLQSQLLGDDANEPQGTIPTYLTKLTHYEQYQPLPPALQANLWRLLAQSNEFVDLGSTVDRAGRPGEAIAYDTTAPSGVILPTRFLLVIDATTGLLLDSERILTADAGKLPVKVPAVIQYTLFLEAGTTESDQAAPGSG